MYKGTKTVPRGSKSTEDWIVHLSEILDYQFICKNKPASGGLLLSVTIVPYSFQSSKPLFHTFINNNILCTNWINKG